MEPTEYKIDCFTFFIYEDKIEIKFTNYYKATKEEEKEILKKYSIADILKNKPIEYNYIQ